MPYEDTPRTSFPQRLAGVSFCPVSLQPLQQGIKEDSEPCLALKCLGPSFWSLSPELELVCWQEHLSPSRGVSLQIFSSLRHQPPSAWLPAARRTDKPAGEVPSRRGLLPSEGRKAPPCPRGRTRSACVGCGPAGPLARHSVIPRLSLRAESRGGTICSVPSVSPASKEGVEPFQLLGHSHLSPGCVPQAPVAPGCSATP